MSVARIKMFIVHTDEESEHDLPSTLYGSRRQFESTMTGYSFQRSSNHKIRRPGKTALG